MRRLHAIAVSIVCLGIDARPPLGGALFQESADAFLSIGKPGVMSHHPACMLIRLVLWKPDLIIKSPLADPDDHWTGGGNLACQRPCGVDELVAGHDAIDQASVTRF